MYKNDTPITDDHGQPTTKQYRVIESKGNWHLVYDTHQISNKIVHEFRIQKITNDIAIYPGATLEYAKQRFDEISEKY